ncbi:MAG TPA: AAA family ATPase [Bryobacteraceae bacterium]|nr:AAA family ATPase [Bryobacteraceae bacterium]
MTSTFLTRIRLKNYKSIATCDVRLGPLRFLVGPNGAGKSNFLDAMRFVTESLRTSLDHAMRDRGGIGEVRRRSAGHPTHFETTLYFQLPGGESGEYGFRIGALPEGGFEIQYEICKVHPPDPLAPTHHFIVEKGVVRDSSQTGPNATKDRLYLVSASGLVQFRPLYDALSRMGFYSLNPDSIRELQSPDAGDVLARDGHNIASVVAQLQKHRPERKERVEEYLSKVVPGISAVDPRVVGPKETLEFRQQMTGSKAPWRFFAANMSDGTLRAFGILVALFQAGNGAGAIPLVGIEEPEIALHPAAAGVLLDALKEASQTTQVIVTSHSPELLDDPDLDPDALLAVSADSGSTHVAPVDKAGREAVKRRLYTPGELLRMNQLRPEAGPIPQQSEIFESKES